MSWHFLQELEVASLEGASLDGAPDVLLSLIPTAVASFSRGNETESLSPSRYGTTLEPLTGGRGEERSTSSAAGSRAKTYQYQVGVQASTGSGADCGAIWRASFARYDRATSSWRTAQCSLLGDSEEFSETWPSSGSLVSGLCSERATPVLPTSAIGSGLWPTPVADGDRTTDYAQGGRSLGAEVRRRSVGKGGGLSPDWIEWLMGWPIGWTASEPLAMDRFRLWLRSHGGC